MIISRTPFRISFFGGGTDFPDYYREHGGAVLLTAMSQYCYITLHRLQPFFTHRFKANYAQTESVMNPSEFKHPLIRETLKLLNITEGMEIAHVADLPGRTGIGSSSSFTVGLLNVLHALKGETSSADLLAREAIRIEREMVGDPGGHQDQYAAAYGGFLRIDFLRDGAVTVKPLRLAETRLATLTSRLMLFYTGIEQAADHILTEQRRNLPANLSTLHAMRGMVAEAETILTGSGSLDDFGDLLHESWMCKKCLSSGISNHVIDQVYESARRAGARGGKLLGAGGRGFLLLYADPHCQEKVSQALSALRKVELGFSKSGSEIIFKANEQ